MNLRWTMTCLKWLGIACLSFLTVIMTSPDGLTYTANPTVAIHNRYYPVTGATIEGIRNQMEQSGPSSNGNRFFGSVQWQVTWDAQWRPVGHQCQVTKANIRTDITYTLPQWQPTQRPAQAVQQQWSRFYSALKLHEDGHREHGVEVSRALLEKLQGRLGNCQTMQQDLNAIANQTIQAYNQADQEYDRRTQHGVTQGAWF